MPNFAVLTTPEVKERGDQLLDRLAASDSEKKGTTLERMFDIVEENMDKHALIEGGVDTAALDAAFFNIRSIFISAVSGRGQIEQMHAKEVESLKSSFAKEKEALSKKIEKASEDRTELTKRIDSLYKELNDTKEALRTSEMSNNQLRALNETFTSQFDTTYRELESTRKKYSELEEKMKKDESSMQELFDEMDTEKKKSDETQEGLKEQIQSLKEELVAAKKDTEMAKAQIESTRAMVYTELSKEHQAEVAGLRGELEKARELVAQYQAMIVDLQVDQIGKKLANMTSTEREP